MSAATANRSANRKDSDLQAYQMNNAVQIYKHTLVSCRVADGYAYPARSGTATDLFLGVSSESKLSGATAGADKVKVHKNGVFDLIASGMAQNNLGAAVYASDDQTVTLTSTNNQLVGYIQEVKSATLVAVRIDRAVN